MRELSDRSRRCRVYRGATSTPLRSGSTSLATGPCATWAGPRADSLRPWPVATLCSNQDPTATRLPDALHDHPCRHVRKLPQEACGFSARMHRSPDPRSRAGYLGRYIGDDRYPRPGQLDCPVVMEITDNVLSTCQPTNVLNHVTLRHDVLAADASTSRNRRCRGAARRELFGGRRSCGVDASGHAHQAAVAFETSSTAATWP